AAKELLQGLIWRSYPWNVFYRPGVYDAVFNHRPYLAHGLRRLPIERQSRFVSIILLLIDCWSLAVKAGRSFQEAVDFALRLSLPPFPSSQVDFNLPCLFMMDRNGNKIDVSAIPDEAFVKILHALKSDNRGHLTTWGINRMIEHDAPRIMAAFSAHPAQTLKACFSLGLLSYAAAGELLSRFDGHEVHQLAHLPDAQMADAALRLVAEGLQSPLPRKLREELEGKIRLTSAQRARAMQKTRRQLEAFKMNILEDLAQRKMRQAIGPAPRDEASVHAIMLAATVDENQRGLRRMLKRHFGGERDYARNHPLSQQWIKRLKKLKFDQWDAGVTQSRLIKELGHVEISVEKDPLEILKMGSYFNTCLGIGGINSHSAAAVALDINKRVLYARAANGRAVARMLTAIDKQERLVCFSVYPHTASGELKIFFKDVARQWAAAMGVSIYKSKKGADDYEIPGVLSRDWYDDGHWEKPANRSQTRSRASSTKR
ncbi:MAG: hypothetical protein OEV92_10550, partial [Nitrospinota bacterium]|nr:hypothetical protein [Nitrospinota bacterium]